MIGARLKELRSELNINQSEIASFLDISIGSYSQYENDKQNPPFDILMKMVDYFKVSTDYLLGRTENRAVELQLSDEEKELLYYFNNVNEISRACMLRDGRYLLGEEQYRAHTSAYQELEDIMKKPKK